MIKNINPRVFVAAFFAVYALVWCGGMDAQEFVTRGIDAVLVFMFAVCISCILGLLWDVDGI